MAAGLPHVMNSDESTLPQVVADRNRTSPLEKPAGGFDSLRAAAAKGWEATNGSAWQRPDYPEAGLSDACPRSQCQQKRLYEETGFFEKTRFLKSSLGHLAPHVLLPVSFYCRDIRLRG